MSREGMTINQAAETLGVSTRTIRRYIKAGKIKAELFPGAFGEEYRIWELPADLKKETGEPPVNHAIQSPVQFMDIVREMHEKNLALAAQLGAATERVKQLEGQLKQIEGPKPVKQSLWQWLRRRLGMTVQA